MSAPIRINPIWKGMATVAILLPLTLLIIAISTYAVNIPIGDQWELIPLFQKIGQGTATFSDFYAQHNEHRILFPRLLIVGLALLSSWNIYYELAVIVLLAVTIFLLLLSLLRHSFINRRSYYWAAVATSLLLFSPNQYENWLWGWQLSWFLNLLGLVLAVWSLGSWKVASPTQRFAVALAGALLASYSLACGFFVWLVCLPLLSSDSTIRRFLPLWIAFFVAVVVLYFFGYTDPNWHPSKYLAFWRPISFAAFCLGYLANPIIPQPQSWELVSFVLFVIFIVTLVYLILKHRHCITTLLPIFCLASYGGLSAASIAISRLGFGLIYSLSSRYIALANLFLFTTVVLLLKTIELTAQFRHPIARYLSTLVLLAIAVLSLINYHRGLHTMNQQHARLVAGRNCALTVNNPNDSCLANLYLHRDRAFLGIQYLRRVHGVGL